MVVATLLSAANIGLLAQTPVSVSPEVKAELLQKLEDARNFQVTPKMFPAVYEGVYAQAHGFYGIFTLKVDHGICPTACYIPNADGGTKAWDWELLDYPFLLA